MTIMAAGEFALSSSEGKQFAKDNFDKLEKAIEFFRKKVDPEDGLAVMKNKNADWCDSINRGGKLGGINIIWARSLRLMNSVAKLLGEEEKARAYREEYAKARKNIMEKFYDKESAYFREEEGVDRLYTTACISGSLYLLDPVECVRVQETLRKRTKVPSGLKNFDPPFPENWQVKVFGIPVIRWFNNGYHNESVWPWLACQNIQVKIKIALNHPDEAVREQYKKEAVEDLADMAKLFKEAGGAYEIFHPETRKPRNRVFYKPPRNLMASLAAYQSAYNKVKKFGWI
ncbi:MAG: GH116 family glycosyl hydrolase [Candidatus Moraniibacteriota bacterium]